ncbi:BglG family transcription antiterminator [Clostridium oceanicum]|uniref:PRD domain-containing protein n=1 Tax=Clostridium oceanicum TaxID=1543 RepID=A0ABP3UT37_9CLOT
MMLSERQINILHYLMKKEICTAHELSINQNVSKRTIRTDIKFISEFLTNYDVEIKICYGKGYRLPLEDEKIAIIEEVIENLILQHQPQEPQHRMIYIIICFLFSKKHVSMESFASKLNVSKATISNDMKRVEEFLRTSNSNLVLEKSNLGSKIIGDEQNFRFFISSSISKDRKTLMNHFHKNKFFNEDNYKKIYTFLIQIFKEAEYEISDIVLENFAFIILITLYRIQQGYYIKSLEISDELENRECLLTSKICSILSSYFKIHIPPKEQLYIMLQLMGSKWYKYKNKSEEKELISFIEKTLEQIYIKYHLNFLGDSQLLDGLVNHLRPLLVRLRYNIKIENTMIEKIKMDYPKAFEIALYFTDKIFTTMGLDGLPICENEITYIALHFQIALEEIKESSRLTIKTAIICPNGQAAAKVIEIQIKKKFSNIEICCILPAYQVHKLKEKKLDLVISNTPLSEKLEIPTVEVGIIFKDRDFDKINRCIKKIYTSFENSIYPEIINISKQYDSKYELLSYIENYLISKGIVPTNFNNSLCEREKIVSTYVGKFMCMPHCVYDKDVSYRIFVVNIKDGLIWDDSKVNLLFVVLLSRVNMEDFEYYVKTIYDIFKLPSSKIQKLINCNTKEKLVNNLKEFKIL